MILQTKFHVITYRESEREIQCLHSQRIFVMIQLQLNMKGRENSHNNADSLLRCQVTTTTTIIIASEQNNCHSLSWHRGHSLPRKSAMELRATLQPDSKSYQLFLPDENSVFMERK